jgi:hypothetical protein
VTSTDAKCSKAARLQQIDIRVKELAQKVQDWLAGKTDTTSPSSSASALDQAAAGLGRLSRAAGNK